MLLKVSFIFGTRPEAIKLAPLIIELKKYSTINVEVCITGQHKEMLKQVLDVFNIEQDVDLALMKENQTLSDFGAAALKSIDMYIKQSKPDWVIVHGDTSTCLYASLAAFYNNTKIAHVEAGLRTNNKFSPFPEEINRTIVAKLADLHFAPTENSKQNLLKDSVLEESIFVTGNTVIDALKIIIEKLNNKQLQITSIPAAILNSENKIVLITMHRRENFGNCLKNMCDAILELSRSFPNVNFVYPVHPNPNVLNPVNEILGNVGNIHLIKPLDYISFVFLMNKSYIIMTDSGGVQEEAPSIGKPVIV